MWLCFFCRGVVVLFQKLCCLCGNARLTERLGGAVGQDAMAKNNGRSSQRAAHGLELAFSRSFLSRVGTAAAAALASRSALLTRVGLRCRCQRCRDVASNSSLHGGGSRCACLLAGGILDTVDDDLQEGRGPGMGAWGARRTLDMARQGGERPAPWMARRHHQQSLPAGAAAHVQPAALAAPLGHGPAVARRSPVRYWRA